MPRWSSSVFRRRSDLASVEPEVVLLQWLRRSGGGLQVHINHVGSVQRGTGARGLATCRTCTSMLLVALHLGRAGSVQGPGVDVREYNKKEKGKESSSCFRGHV